MMQHSQGLTGAVAAVALIASGLAAAAPAPVQVFIDTVSVGTVSWSADGSGGFVTTPTVFGLGGNRQVSLGQGTFTPIVNGFGTGWSFAYGVGFDNNSPAASTLRLEFDPLPFSPGIGVPVTGYASVVATLSDGTGDGMALDPPAGASVQTVTLLPGSGDNVLLSQGGSSIGLGPSFSSNSFQYGDFNTTQSIAPGPWIGLKVVSEFRVSPNNDSVALDGVVTITPVPEPSTFALFGLGVGLAGFALNRSPRKRLFRA
jgi:hypothetical protein